jgi:hypothetical protein
MASRADKYRRRAQQCLEMAGTFQDRKSQAALSHMAQAWLRLAERHDFMPRAAEPVVQQQGQIRPQQAQRRPTGEREKNRR